MRKVSLVVALVATLTTGMASPALADQSFWGGVMGASLGGFLGSQIGRGSGRLAATGLGVATGALIGSNIGSSMDRSNRVYSGGYAYGNPVMYQVAPYQPTYVAPPDPPVRVVYVPQPVYVTGGYVGVAETRECRPYVQKTQIGNQIRETRGLACLESDGTWRVQ